MYNPDSSGFSRRIPLRLSGSDREVYNQPAAFLPETSQQNPKQLYFMLTDSFCAFLLKLRTTYIFINHEKPCFCISISIITGATRRRNPVAPWCRKDG